MGIRSRNGWLAPAAMGSCAVWPKGPPSRSSPRAQRAETASWGEAEVAAGRGGSEQPWAGRWPNRLPGVESEKRPE